MCCSISKSCAKISWFAARYVASMYTSRRVSEYSRFSSFFCFYTAVIAGGVIGFLFAIFLILLLVYRMRKKDEGSYDLGERKPSATAYQKAPTKEFYA